MKILAFSDLHRDAKALHEIMQESGNADILIGAGDFATQGLGTDDTMLILAKAKIPVIIVSGNHDDTKVLRAICNRFENLHMLHGEVLSINGVDFFGLGDEIPHRNDAEWNQSLSENEAADMLQACPAAGVLITHSPPLGYCDQQENGTHEGSAAIRDTIKLKQPVLNLCGHIHEAWNTTAMIGETQVFNLGPTAHWFDV
ncbi:metallophosphoesterase [Amylibacter sp. SFDW26]|uniref:metallophosphoesterase family protein n=1 Tax=Amylibacter sp. SFDW26 TaxID=2652722 RepID=UPI001869F243|nr:metallophosphoesterase [Amylibacter sp. SFDW26]